MLVVAVVILVFFVGADPCVCPSGRATTGGCPYRGSAGTTHTSDFLDVAFAELLEELQRDFFEAIHNDVRFA
jgi:hypothetical protein